MSELKDYSILDIEAIDDERFKKESAPGKWVQESRVYLKSEADKVIAHHKHKRCMAMADSCEYEAMVVCYNEPRIEWLGKWKLRWLELAEKFKEVK